MARQPNYKRMYSDTMNLLKLRRQELPQKEEVKREIPEDFKDNGTVPLKFLALEVLEQIDFFQENRGKRNVPPTLTTLYNRLIKVNEDMTKINNTLVKVEIQDYEQAYNEVVEELRKVEEELKELED